MAYPQDSRPWRETFQQGLDILDVAGEHMQFASETADPGERRTQFLCVAALIREGRSQVLAAINKTRNYGVDSEVHEKRLQALDGLQSVGKIVQESERPALGVQSLCLLLLKRTADEWYRVHDLYVEMDREFPDET